MNKYKNLLITGGCGFIGSNLIDYLCDKYPHLNIYNIDRMDYCASSYNVTTTSPNYHFIQGDITSFELIQQILETYSIDIIMHLAAQSHVDNSFNNSKQCIQDNIIGTHTLLEASRLYKKIQLFFHVSTDEVYGQSPIDTNEKMIETSPLNPTNPYAATKAGAEVLVTSYNHSFNLPTIITRGNNVYGKAQYPEKLIPKFVYLLKNNKQCTIHGEGKSIRSFIHVLDVCNAFDIIVEKGIIGEIYNIGSNDEFSVIDVTKLLIKWVKDADCDIWIKYVPDRNFNDQRYNISNEKLTRLGWKQNIDFIEGLRECVKWYMELDADKHWNNNII
jgi:UDP-glucose 4,6-dehydratase